MALTRKGAPFVWTDRQQTAFEALKACLVCAPILGFPIEGGRFVLDTDTSLFAVGGVLSQLQQDMEVVIAYASRSLVSAIVSATILYDPPGNAGSGDYVHAPPVISPRCAMHPPNRS